MALGILSSRAMIAWRFSWRSIKMSLWIVRYLRSGWGSRYVPSIPQRLTLKKRAPLTTNPCPASLRSFSACPVQASANAKNNNPSAVAEATTALSVSIPLGKTKIYRTATQQIPIRIPTDAGTNMIPVRCLPFFLTALDTVAGAGGEVKVWVMIHILPQLS